MRLKNLLKAGIFNLIFQFLFLTSMYILGLDVRIELDAGLRFLTLVLMVFSSGLVWVGFFYLQDRRKPEPVPYIIVSFITGMAIWALLGHPLINLIFQTREWIHASMLLFVLGSFFIYGMVFSLLLFSFLRFVFMPLKEFDEPVDGMVYGAAVGAGFAAVKSLQSLWGLPEYTLFTIAYIITTQVLIYSGVGSIIGYFFGKAKFQKSRIQFFSVTGVSIGMVTLGIFHVFNEFLFLSGFTHAFWLSFGFTIVYTILIFGYCVIKMRRLTETKPEKPTRSRFSLRPAMIFYSLVLLTAAAVIANYGNQGKRYINANDRIYFRYPHTLSFHSFQESNPSTHVADNNTETLFWGENQGYPNFYFSLEIQKKAARLNHSELSSYISVPQTESLLVKNTAVGHKTGKRIVYSYLDRSEEKSTEFPLLRKVITDIIPIKNRLFIFTFSAAGCDFEAGKAQYKKIISSVNWIQ